MGFFDKMKEMLNKNNSDKNKKFIEPVIDIKTSILRDRLLFILHNISPELLSGIEIIEDVFERDAHENQIILRSTMSPIDIKRKIGEFIYKNGRWEKQEEITRKLLAREKIDLQTFENVHGTSDFKEVYDRINADVFAICYGNDTITLDEIAVAINTLYMKKYTEKNFSTQSKIENLINNLFEENEK